MGRTDAPRTRCALRPAPSGRGYLRLARRWWADAPQGGSRAGRTVRADVRRTPPRPLVLGALAAVAGLDAERLVRLCAHEDRRHRLGRGAQARPLDPLVATGWVLHAHGRRGAARRALRAAHRPRPRSPRPRPRSSTVLLQHRHDETEVVPCLSTVPRPRPPPRHRRPVGTGKSYPHRAAVPGNCDDTHRLGVITNDIYTDEDARVPALGGRARTRTDPGRRDRRVPAHGHPRRRHRQPLGRGGPRARLRPARPRARGIRRRQPHGDVLPGRWSTPRSSCSTSPAAG